MKKKISTYSFEISMRNRGFSFNNGSGHPFVDWYYQDNDNYYPPLKDHGISKSDDYIFYTTLFKNDPVLNILTYENEGIGFQRYHYEYKRHVLTKEADNFFTVKKLKIMASAIYNGIPYFLINKNDEIELWTLEIPKFSVDNTKKGKLTYSVLWNINNEKAVHLNYRFFNIGDKLNLLVFSNNKTTYGLYGIHADPSDIIVNDFKNSFIQKDKISDIVLNNNIEGLGELNSLMNADKITMNHQPFNYRNDYFIEKSEDKINLFLKEITKVGGLSFRSDRYMPTFKSTRKTIHIGTFDKELKFKLINKVIKEIDINHDASNFFHSTMQIRNHWDTYIDHKFKPNLYTKADAKKDVTEALVAYRYAKALEKNPNVKLAVVKKGVSKDVKKHENKGWFNSVIDSAYEAMKAQKEAEQPFEGRPFSGSRSFDDGSRGKALAYLFLEFAKPIMDSIKKENARAKRERRERDHWEGVRERLEYEQGGRNAYDHDVDAGRAADVS